MARQFKVMITSCGTSTAVNIIKALAKYDDISIVTTDINDADLLPGVQRWGTEHYKVPLATETEKYLQEIEDICRKEKVDFIYPIHDLEIQTLLDHRDYMEGFVKLPVMPASAIKHCNDKWANAQSCEAEKISVPETILGSQLSSADSFPKFRKPRSGVGSVGSFMVERFEDLGSEDLTDRVIFQQPCDFPEYTVDALVLGEDVAAIARERLETKAGVCTKARVFVDPDLSEIAAKLAKVFDLRGLFCFQVMHGRNDLAGEYVLTDLNPRSGGGTGLTQAAGYEILDAYFLAMLDHPMAVTGMQNLKQSLKAQDPVFVCRLYEEVVTKAG